MSGLVRGARVLNPLAALAVVLLVFAQVYLIAEYVFGQAGALSAHKTVGGIVPIVEAVVAATAVVGWRRDRAQLWMSVALFVVGVLQVSFAENLGNSPGVHAFHGALALVVLWLASQLAVRKRREVLAALPASGA